MRLTGLLLALMLLFPTFLQAKSPEQVKSAFLFQIAKFVEFPKVNNKQAVTFCFYDVEHGIGELLKDNSNLKINDIPIETVLINKKQQISELSRFCDITYIDETMEDDIIPLWIDTISLSTLTVGESISFLEKGGVVSLVQEGNKIRLYINKQQLLRSSFKVQSRLLAVSKFHPN
ncbi:MULTISPECIES: YfiR family protein [Pseudoalteromonas]|uniref:YfiR family protein n=1 Tax=Pseudoalteromonas neustonica TaxID=1840331 RepID=A0ABY3FDZ0_9GAMM|nr:MULTISPECIES: YfiR family protein [Pseudoalteromonas]MBB1303422.1 YfiR family protein [Pseudoalteromonas sp. SR44-8]MBB1310036.1 YfiR family protein [Pseudoalteromonas sp. SR41-8]MBB1396884.1 YfiR family protein [Pseudoalteromonas sp. SG44-8]MBB1409658.1 YfiR family protein [Pseudoalteromonas sp. SG44-17]TVU83545.1 YfiR family protein [Pseudoalteromonas neustonica]|tara:strand:+ start:4362 stop:4886 length:525 start_codon:yes stop_codon:yes gene_type:complete